MSIKNFGLRWRRDVIHWGAPGAGNAGALKGIGPISAAVSDQKEVEFRDQIGVYILYQDDRLLYVGQTGSGAQRLFVRLRQHTNDYLADRWNAFSWFGIRNVNQDGSLSAHEGALNRTINAADMLNLIEGLLLHVTEPPLNKQGARWPEINQYKQSAAGWHLYSDRELLVLLANHLKIEPE